MSMPDGLVDTYLALQKYDYLAKSLVGLVLKKEA